ncbi:hypothetical protein [Xylophilus sp. ASV27]|uniref:hypothetical protein n=1 Tax=Xylophilus sp. ASV27 TaxID=2795129 RepID=UPI001E4080EF|nr:hypothetical protein [Xylophilus sp. ASV27]
MPVDTLLNLVRLLDGVIILTAIEGTALLVHHRLTGRGLGPGAYLLNLVSGLCLMAALRCAVGGSDSLWIVLWLTAAGAAHGVDMWKRWSGAASTR